MNPFRITTLAVGCITAATALFAQGNPERHESTEALSASTDGFLVNSGEEIYMVACAGCHQPQGQGALGAAQYPTLAANPRLQSARYPAWIVVNGMGAMPAFNDWLSNEQIVEVVTYIQQNLGNRYDSSLTPEEVQNLRDAPSP
ncbi:cytochrome c [Dinoroseobacter sp. PD6]|uniref:c-type cytochrome n=1 Tax=Dinoroseobacter sp. PD6 TaxID=3028384 RepID=UPI00237A5E34|nr:cytochrome c [Dinoroseobacter sp. PD6]MDD9718989.1 cytochrome c [Dinoroseobacter sp. PD6]